MDSFIKNNVIKESRELGKKIASKSVSALNSKVVSCSKDGEGSFDYVKMLNSAYNAFLDGFDLEWQERFEF